MMTTGCSSLSTCVQSISFCKARELICFSKCGKVNQVCGGGPVEYYNNFNTALVPNGFVTINNEDNEKKCIMRVTVTDATGNHIFDVAGGQTYTLAVAGFGKLSITCIQGEFTSQRCVGEWAFEGYYEALPVAY